MSGAPVAVSVMLMAPLAVIPSLKVTEVPLSDNELTLVLPACAVVIAAAFVTFTA